MSRRAAALCLVLGAGFLAPSPSAQQPAAGSASIDDAAAVVELTSVRLADTIAARHAELSRDRGALVSVIAEQLRPKFDFERGARVILGDHLGRIEDRDVADATARRFAEALYGYIVAQFGHLLLDYKRDTLALQPFERYQDRAAQRVVVPTVVTLNDGTKVKVRFIMAVDGDGNWLVQDVQTDGSSYLRNYKSQFSVDLGKEGIDAVTQWLEERTAALEAERRGGR